MHPLSFDAVLVRLGAAVLVGALIGLDRQIRNKPAGLRTIALVSLGSAVFVMTALEGATVDSASRVIQGIVTGVGFLGAGSIVHGRTEESVHGLTTAASIWLAAALGMACGLAYWPIVAAGCGFGVVILVTRADRSLVKGPRSVTSERRDLQIDDDPEFQKKEWRAQRIGIALLALLVAAAAAGLTGMGGPLNDAEAGRQGDPVFVEFERVVRQGATSTMTVHLHHAPGVVKFWVSAPYLENVRIASIDPEPERVVVEQSRQVYEVQAGSADVEITFVIEHVTVGRLDAEIGLVDGPSVRLGQWALF